jgi:glycosyltransferase involved in cell wall biosynthesis
MLVSILIPVYNAELYLGECLDSVLAQTHHELQIIAINDGSTDSSASILNDYASRDSRLQIVHRENRGVAATRLELLSFANGEYIHFVDADDAVQPDMVGRMLRMCEDNNLDMLICHSTNDMTITAATKSEDEVDVIEHDTAICEFLEHRRFVGALWSKLIRRELCQNLQCPSGISYGEDAYLCWQILRHINRLGFTNGKFYHYRMNGSSISHKPLGLSKMSSRILWKYVVEETSALYPHYLTLAKGQRGRNSLMLLFDAAIGGYTTTNFITELKSDVRRDYVAMRKSGIVERNKFIFYQLSKISWPLTRFIARLIYN